MIFTFVSLVTLSLCDAMLLRPDVHVLRGAWHATLQETCKVWAEADTERQVTLEKVNLRDCQLNIYTNHCFIKPSCKFRISFVTLPTFLFQQYIQMDDPMIDD